MTAVAEPNSVNRQELQQCSLPRAVFQESNLEEGKRAATTRKKVQCCSTCFYLDSVISPCNLSGYAACLTSINKERKIRVVREKLYLHLVMWTVYVRFRKHG